jgi:hypothetical protein
MLEESISRELEEIAEELGISISMAFEGKQVVI